VVDGTTNAPIAGVVVTLAPARQQIGQAVRQLTDEKGRFVFEDLGPEPDGYSISARKVGYIDGYYGKGVGGVPGSRIPLAQGEWFADARVVIYRPAAISGTLTDEQGAAVVGAYVRVLTQVMIAGTPHLAVGPLAKTDDRGIYRIANLSPGSYVVHVPSVQVSVPRATPESSVNPLGAALEIDSETRLLLGRYPMPPPTAGGQLQVYAPTFFPGISIAALAQVIEVTPGQERENIDLRLQAVRAVRVSGIVTGPPEAFAGLPLRLLAAGAESLGAGSETATTIVGADGAFAFVNVPSGRYTLDARATAAELSTMRPSAGALTLPLAPNQLFYSGVFPAEYDIYPQYRTTSGPGSGAYWGRTSLDVADQDLTGVVVAMQRGTTISGRTILESTAKNPPPVLLDKVEPANGDISLSKLRRSGRRGEPNDLSLFTFEGLMPGQYFLRASIAPGLIKSVVWNGRDMTYTPFDTTDGRDFTDVIVTFTDRPITLNGMVNDARGQPARDAVVIAFPIEREQWSNYGFNPARIKPNPAAANGTFRYQNLPAGDYFVVGVGPAQGDEWRNPKFLEAASALATRVRLDWGTTTNIDVRLVQVQVR
jgi:hypothetical protein